MLLRANSGTWQYGGEGENPLQNIMMDQSIYKVSFLNFIVPNSFWKYQTILHTVNIHVRGWEMSKSQREWITPVSAPLQRSYGVVAVSQEYQNFKKSETVTLSQPIYVWFSRTIRTLKRWFRALCTWSQTLVQGFVVSCSVCVLQTLVLD